MTDCVQAPMLLKRKQLLLEIWLKQSKIFSSIKTNAGCNSLASMTTHRLTSRLQHHEEEGKGAGALISSSIRPRFHRVHTSVLKRNVWEGETQFRGILVPKGLVVS